MSIGSCTSCQSSGFQALQAYAQAAPQAAAPFATPPAPPQPVAENRPIPGSSIGGTINTSA